MTPFAVNRSEKCFIVTGGLFFIGKEKGVSYERGHSVFWVYPIAKLLCWGVR